MDKEIRKEAIEIAVRLLPEHPHLHGAVTEAYIEGYSKAMKDFKARYKYIIK